MPGKHSAKQKRQAKHIAASERARGRSPEEAERIAWATVNKGDGPTVKMTSRPSTGAEMDTWMPRTDAQGTTHYPGKTFTSREAPKPATSRIVAQGERQGDVVQTPSPRLSPPTNPSTSKNPNLTATPIEGRRVNASLPLAPPPQQSITQRAAVRRPSTPEPQARSATRSPMQTRKSGSMKKDLAEYGLMGAQASLAGETPRPMKPRVVGKQAAEAQQTAAPSLATRLAAVRGDYARRTGDTAGAMPKPEKPVPAMDYSKMKKPPIMAAKSSALGKAGEVRLPGASPSRSSPPVPTSLRKLSISKLVERKKQGITHLGSRDFVAKKAAKGFQIVSLDDAYAFMKAGEAPPAPQGSGPPKKFPRRDKTPNVLGKPTAKALSNPYASLIGPEAVAAGEKKDKEIDERSHARDRAWIAANPKPKTKKALATGYGKVSGGGALKAPNRGFPVEESKSIKKGSGGLKPTPLAARAPQAAQRSSAPKKPVNLEIGDVTVKPAPKPVNLEIGPATVTSLGPPKKPMNLEIGPATVTSLGPPKATRVAARKGLSIADLQRAMEVMPRPKGPVPPTTVYLPGAHGPDVKERAAKMRAKTSKRATTKKSTPTSKKSPRVLDDGGAALMGSMPPPTLMKPNNVVQKSKGTSMSKTNFNNLFKSELGIPNDEVLCDCPHCDAPITKSDLVAKASGGEMVVSQNPTGGTMRGGTGRGVLTPSRGVPGAKQTDEVRMVGDKSKKKLVSKAHDSDSCSDDASSGDALSGAPPKKMSKSTVRGTDFVQYIDYAGAPGSDAAIAKSIAEGAIGQQPTQPMDLNNDLTRLLV